jgi:hypothetical protein
VADLRGTERFSAFGTGHWSEVFRLNPYEVLTSLVRDGRVFEKLTADRPTEFFVDKRRSAALRAPMTEGRVPWTRRLLDRSGDLQAAPLARSKPDDHLIGVALVPPRICVFHLLQSFTQQPLSDLSRPDGVALTKLLRCVAPEPFHFATYFEPA